MQEASRYFDIYRVLIRPLKQTGVIVDQAVEWEDFPSSIQRKSLFDKTNRAGKRYRWPLDAFGRLVLFYDLDIVLLL